MAHDEALVRSIRLNALERLILNQPQREWRTKELADLFHVSVDTMSDDLAMLGRPSGIPLTTTGKGPNTRWILAGDIKLPLLPPLHLDYVQGAVLYAAARLLSQQQDERNDAVRLALLQLVSVMPAPLRPHLEGLVADMVPAEALGNVSQIFSVLSQGWLSRRVVTLDYEPPRRHRYSCHFAPYLLEPSGIGRTLYFIGHSDPPGKLRVYKLERIRHATLTDESFVIPDDFDGAALLRRAWGVMYGDGDLETVKLRFSQFVSSRVRETRWHPSETLSETAEGLVWEAQIGDLTEIRPWIRGWGADCEVLAPVALRDEMIREVNRLQRRYGLARTSPSDDGPDQNLLDALYGKE